MAALLKELRLARGISQLQLAAEAGVNVSVAHRAEQGGDAKLSTWGKLFEGLGYRILIDATELAEETADLLAEERDRRLDRRAERRPGLPSGNPGPLPARPSVGRA
jgi:transcriptional regulator with XRE-family HTH domain